MVEQDNEPQSLFRGEGEASDSDTGEDPGPPASALTRRRALVPPKLLTDTANYDSHDHDHTQTLNGYVLVFSCTTGRRRKKRIKIHKDRKNKKERIRCMMGNVVMGKRLDW